MINLLWDGYIFGIDAKWFIAPICLIFGLYSFYRANRSHNAQSTTQVGGRIVDNTGKTKYTAIGSFWFGVILTLAAIVIFIAQLGER